jgi:hypothetical protein
MSNENIYNKIQKEEIRENEEEIRENGTDQEESTNLIEVPRDREEGALEYENNDVDELSEAIKEKVNNILPESLNDTQREQYHSYFYYLLLSYNNIESVMDVFKRTVFRKDGGLRQAYQAEVMYEFSTKVYQKPEYLKEEKNERVNLRSIKKEIIKGKKIVEKLQNVDILHANQSFYKTVNEQKLLVLENIKKLCTIGFEFEVNVKKQKYRSQVVKNTIEKELKPLLRQFERLEELYIVKVMFKRPNEIFLMEGNNNADVEYRKEKKHIDSVLEKAKRQIYGKEAEDITFANSNDVLEYYELYIKYPAEWEEITKFIVNKNKKNIRYAHEALGAWQIAKNKGLMDVKHEILDILDNSEQIEGQILQLYKGLNKDDLKGNIDREIKKINDCICKLKKIEFEKGFDDKRVLNYKKRVIKNTIVYKLQPLKEFYGKLKNRFLMTRAN